MRKRILFADDDPAVLKMTTLRLESSGFEVIAVPDGEEVLQRVSAQPAFDLFLIDLKMPKLDGFQVCERLKGDPATARIPIILFTGSETETRWQGLTAQCIELGVTDWLRKPFRSNELLEKVHHVLGLQRGSDV